MKRLFLPALVWALFIGHIVSNVAEATAIIRTRRSEHFVLMTDLSEMQDRGITNAQLDEVLGYLETGYDKFVTDIQFMEPAFSGWRNRHICKLYPFDRNSGTLGFYRAADGILHLNMWKFANTSSVIGNTARILPVTAVHELFHGVQASYDIWEDPWIKEATAQWSEDQAFPNNSDYVGHEKLWLEHPHYPLHYYAKDADGDTDTSQGRPYGSSIFMRFLSQHHPLKQGVIRFAWEHSAANEGPNSIEALAKAMAGESAARPEILLRPGAKIKDVVTGGPADKAGIKVGDRIVSTRGIPIHHPTTAKMQLKQGTIGKRTSLIVSRGGELLNVYVVPTDNPDNIIDLDPWYGLSLEASSDPLPSDSQKLHPSRRTAPKIFDGNNEKLASVFRDYYDRFVVGAFLMEAAPANSKIPNAELFKRAGAPAGTGTGQGGLDDSIKRAKTTSLENHWIAHHVVTFVDRKDAGLRLGTNSNSLMPGGATITQIGGLGTRYYRVSPLDNFPENTPIQVEIKAGEREVSLQAMVGYKDLPEWQIFKAKWDPTLGVHRVVIPRPDETADWAPRFAVTRYDDSPDMVGLPAYEMVISGAKPPIVSEIKVTQKGKDTFLEKWVNVEDANKLVTSRTHSREQKDKIDPEGPQVTLSVTFSQPVEARKDKVMFKLDGEDITFTAGPKSIIWTAEVPAKKLEPNDTGHKLRVNAQALIEDLPAILPLDEDPLSIAKYRWDDWVDYEVSDDGKEYLIAKDEQEDSKVTLHDLITTTPQTLIDPTLWMEGKLLIENWIPYTLSAVEYDASLDPKSEQRYMRWLIRFDYGGITTYQYIDGPVSEDMGALTIQGKFLAPRVGPIPVKATVFTGVKDQPELKFDYTFEVRDRGSWMLMDDDSYKVFSELNARSERSALTEMGRENADATMMQRYRANWINLLIDKIELDFHIGKHTYLFDNVDTLIEQIDERLETRDDTIFGSRITTNPGRPEYFPHKKVLETKMGLLLVTGQFDRLDTLMREIEAAWAALPEGHGYYVKPDAWLTLANIYMLQFFNADKAVEILDRLSKINNYDPQIQAIRSYTDAVKKVREKLPEAFE